MDFVNILSALEAPVGFRCLAKKGLVLSILRRLLCGIAYSPKDMSLAFSSPIAIKAIGSQEVCWRHVLLWPQTDMVHGDLHRFALVKGRFSPQQPGLEKPLPTLGDRVISVWCEMEREGARMRVLGSGYLVGPRALMNFCYKFATSARSTQYKHGIVHAINLHRAPSTNTKPG